MSETIGKTTESVLGFPVDVAKAGVETLAGENPIPKVKESFKQALWDSVALSPKLFWDMIIGMAKGTLHLTWEAIKHLPIPLPILDSWKQERGDVAMRTKDALELFKFDNRFPPLFTQNEQEPHAATA